MGLRAAGMSRYAAPGPLLHNSGRTLAAALLCILAFTKAARADDELYANVESADGLRRYLYYRAGYPLTADEAKGRCTTLGGTLSSFGTPNQVNESIWNAAVVAGAATTDTSLLWVGLTVSWPAPSGPKSTRRMLHNREAQGSLEGGGMAAVHDDSLYGQLLKEMASSALPVPTTTNDGRRLPEPIRMWMYITQHRRDLLERHGDLVALRSLLSADDEYNGPDDPPDPTVGAVWAWQDGANTSLVAQNMYNVGFLGCAKKVGGRCCGAVFDIGPDPYPHDAFPTIYMYECDDTESRGNMVPTAYTCTLPATAELPKPTSGEQAPRPGGSPHLVCKKGAAPKVLRRREVTRCKKCAPGAYSEHGVECVQCPAGMTTARRGATSASSCFATSPAVTQDSAQVLPPLVLHNV